jgi:hypothetical protein
MAGSTREDAHFLGAPLERLASVRNSFLTADQMGDIERSLRSMRMIARS